MALQNNHREMLNYRLDLESVRLCGSIGSLPEPAGPTGQSTPGVPHCQVYPRLLSHGELRVSCETRCFLSVAATAPQGHPGQRWTGFWSPTQRGLSFDICPQCGTFSSKTPPASLRRVAG